MRWRNNSQYVHSVVFACNVYVRDLEVSLCNVVELAEDFYTRRPCPEPLRHFNDGWYAVSTWYQVQDRRLPARISPKATISGIVNGQHFCHVKYTVLVVELTGPWQNALPAGRTLGRTLPVCYFKRKACQLASTDELQFCRRLLIIKHKCMSLRRDKWQISAKKVLPLALRKYGSKIY